MPDREIIKALEDFNKNRICLPHLIPWDEIADAIELLKKQETSTIYICPNCGTWVSAENVVRCKDCKYHFVDGDNVRFNMCLLNHNKVQPDNWYCADGERSVKFDGD